MLLQHLLSCFYLALSYTLLQKELQLYVWKSSFLFFLNSPEEKLLLGLQNKEGLNFQE